MAALLSRLLILLAVLVAPLTMAGHAAAMASPPAPQATVVHHRAAEMAAEHCAGASDERPKDRPGQAFDCAIACAALPAMPARVAEISRMPAPLDPPAPACAPRGLHPEAATPPPRIS
ncbi:hypothetical protein E2493_03880 [Sphingomonas parva]|uniref:CopY family transcriptional regulator n=1 Tax=Sphingomonas parva TaxID=2555898 RepID=A0A4Y8ZUD5_9SPHN|nr:hypothetical protein [Sphingomonas parva]TFI59621.1 hypothetical protein E2493_03880 [Sphingomonas parva]